MADKLKIKGKVTIWQGEGEDKKIIVKEAPNKWVDQGLKGLLSALLCKTIGSPSYMWTYQWKMYLGQDTTTATSHNLTALTDPIGSAPGTEPNTTYGENISNPATGEWKTAFVAIWNAGTVSGTVGEVALYLRAFDNMTAEWTGSRTYPRVMVSRIASADGSFSPFTIDTSKSLTVYWEVVMTFE